MVGWSKGILEFRFGPNLGLRLETWTKLNNYSIIVRKAYFETKAWFIHKRASFYWLALDYTITLFNV